MNKNLDLTLMSDFKKSIYEKEKNLIKDYKEMYINTAGANQLKVFEVLAKKYGYSNKYSVRAKFQDLKKKYGENLEIS